MPPTTVWPALTSADVTSTKELVTKLKFMFDRDRVVEQAPMALHIGTRSATVFDNANIVHTQRVRYPGWMITGRKVRVALRLRIAPASTATLVSFRLQQALVVGTTATHDDGTYTVKESELILTQDHNDREEDLEIALWTNVPGQVVEATTIDLIGNMRFAD